MSWTPGAQRLVTAGFKLVCSAWLTKHDGRSDGEVPLQNRLQGLLHALGGFGQEMLNFSLALIAGKRSTGS